MTDLIITCLIAYVLCALSVWMKDKGVTWASMVASILYWVFTIKFAVGLFGFVPHHIGGIVGVLVSLLVLVIFIVVPIIVNLIILFKKDPEMLAKAIAEGMVNDFIRKGWVSPIEENQETKRDGESVPPSTSHDI